MKPSLPNTPSSLSHWHRTTRSFPYLHTNHSVDVPISSRYVIIGSGLSGALTAYHLLERGVSGRAILILEAREAVSGASGRNAGHVRPDAFRGFPVFSARHGPEQARKILESEKMVLEIVKSFVEENEVDCDFLYRTTMDVCLSKEFAAYQLKAMESYKAAGGDTSHVQVYRGQEAQAKTGMSNAISAYAWPAASNHPGKLCQWILSAVLAKGVKLWTHCPAIKISENRGSELRWNVETPRGTVSADTIVHCTNAHAAVLLPQLASFITPHRSQAHAFIPTFAHSGANTMKHTLSLRYGLDHFISVNPLRDGTIVLGGSGTRSDMDVDPSSLARMITFDDSGHDERISQNSQREFEDLAASRGVSSLRPGEGLDHVWAGILGMTFDNVPLIGPIDGLDGQWICAGFNGHGMARIFACAPGLVKLMFGEEWADTGLPECFQFSRERINMCLREAEKSVL
ncbi:hypothetical protein FDECE_14157 [Fusarium decemcellulare]|nr:hypothetical protein FDECE_14157 [Fusarium decemcellulare]